VPPFPLAARVLEVIADLGEGSNPRYRPGSGCVVAGRTVLTAAHVVADAVAVLVRGPDKILHQAAADPKFMGDAYGPGPDLALIEIIDDAVDAPPMGLGAVVRDSAAGDPVERCHVIGYPTFMERQAPDASRFRETADALGQISVLSGLARGLLSVQVSSSPEPLPPAQTALGDSPWSGMSGGPVVVDGLLLGVVTEHAPRAGSTAITATPLTALDADPNHPGWGSGVADPSGWWARLGVTDATKLKWLPAVRRHGRPAYWATVKEIRRRTGMLTGRQDDLAAIGAFIADEGGYRWLVGDAWAGKTALLAEGVLTLPIDTDVICYFLSRREADADSSGFLTAVVPQLANLLDEDPPASDLQHFRDLWRRAVERAEAEGRHLLLVVDGLDEDLRPPGLPSVAALLPAAADGSAHVLVSSRPHPELPADVPVGHQLRGVQPVLVQPFAGALELEVLARQEIDDLLRRDDDGLAADVLGLLAAAAGPLAVRDLTGMTIAGPQSVALTRRIRVLLTTSAARSVQPVGLDRYQFAHESLLAHAQADDDLNDPDFRLRIHRWAEGWRVAGWPIPTGGERGTPQYLLDNYASTLAHDRQRLAQLACDIEWVVAAITSVGVDRVLADLRRALAANPADTAIAAILAAVTGQTYGLRRLQPFDQHGFILRQLWIQMAELGEDEVADSIRSRLQSLSGPRLVPEWTTRRASPALSGELGQRQGWVLTVTVLGDGRVVSGEADGRVLIRDPADPGAGPMEVGRHVGVVWSVAAFDDRHVVSGGVDGRVLVWDLADPGAAPVEVGRHADMAGHATTVRALAVLGDGRVVSGGVDGRVLVWDLADPGAAPVEVGHHQGTVRALAVLGDGRVVSGGTDGRVLVGGLADPGAAPVEVGRHADMAGRVTTVRALAVLGDGRVVSGGSDGRVMVWDLADPDTAPVEVGRHTGTVGSLAELRDGRVVTGGGTGWVLVWDLGNPGAAPVEVGRHEGAVLSVAVLGGSQVVSGGDRRVLIWNVTGPGGGQVELSGYMGEVRALAVFSDGRVAIGAHRSVLIWNSADSDVAPVELGRHRGTVRAVAILGDGRVVSGGKDKRVLVWDPVDPGPGPIELGRHTRAVWALAVLGDGRVVSGGSDGRVLVWDPADPGLGPVELGRHRGTVWAVAVLGDGRRVVSGGSDGRVLIWDAADPNLGSVALGRHTHAVQAVAALPDGRVAAAANQSVLIWDPVRPGATPTELGHHNDAVRSVVALHDGYVVTGGTDQRVVVWDQADGSNPVNQVSCSVTALAATQLGTVPSIVAIAHGGSGFSCWSFKNLFLLSRLWPPRSALGRSSSFWPS
jgi:WD40 repeat protein